MFYELVALLRPDIALDHIGKFCDDLKRVIEGDDGTLEGSEYWGFRTLAYRIQKRGKAHYVYLGLSLDTQKLSALKHFLKFHADLMRFLLLKKPEGLTFPTSLHAGTIADAMKGIAPSVPFYQRDPSPIKEGEPSHA